MLVQFMEQMMRYVVCLIFLLECSAVLWSQPMDDEHHYKVVVALDSLITTEKWTIDEAAQILANAGFMYAGKYEESDAYWIIGSEGPKPLDFIGVEESVHGEVIDGVAWLWRLGFFGVVLEISRDIGLCELSALALRAEYLPEIINICLNAGYSVVDNSTRVVENYSEVNDTQLVYQIILAMRMNIYQIYIYQIRDYVVLKRSLTGQ